MLHTVRLLFVALIGATGLQIRITFTDSLGELGPCTDASTCNHGVSLSEIRIYAGEEPMAVNGISNPSGVNPANHPASKLIDGVEDTSKWLDLNFTITGQSVLLLDVDDEGGTLTPTGLELVTGNNPTKRDPVMWVVEIQNDCDGWSVINRMDTPFQPPDARWAPYTESPFVLDATNLPTGGRMQPEQHYPLHLPRSPGRLIHRRRHTGRDPTVRGG